MQSTNAADLLAQIRVHGAVPRHVAIIMDGNGRWAEEQGLVYTNFRSLIETPTRDGR